MDVILDYLNALPPAKRDTFARKCGTTVGYLRKAISAKQRLGESIVINMERESGGAIRCEQVRSDVDWAFLRGTARKRG